MRAGNRLLVGSVFAMFWLLACSGSRAPAADGAGGNAGSQIAPVAGAGGSAGSQTAPVGGAAGSAGSQTTPDGGASPDGSPPQGVLPAAATADLQRLAGLIAGTKKLDAASLQAAHPVTHGALGYNPLDAQYMSLINGSPLALSSAESQILGNAGFVISDRKRFCSFYDGLDAIYAADLPVFISADAIMEAVHKSYDAALKNLETDYLSAEVKRILDGMRLQLAGSTASAEQRADADLYLTVALRLLTGTPAPAVAGASDTTAAELVQSAMAASAMSDVTLFGQQQSIDFSQFTPRGHYTESAALQQYFRAMMWMGRTPMRLVSVDEWGNQVLERRQVDAAVLMTDLLGVDGLRRWGNVEQVLAAFVGEKDNLAPPEIPKLLADLGATRLADLAAVDDARMLNAILLGGYGTQRIVSQIMYNGIDRTLPQERVFLLFGQRYVIDSHVFSNVVYDRVQGGSVRRMMPSTLDVAYAALGNDDALPLLSAELTAYHYAPDLESMRLLVDDHGDAYWRGSLYTHWLDTLRALSPRTALAPSVSAALPAVARSEAWGRRLLNTQLGSWAELRHDTLLYAKQSYTSYPGCEYPDAYVDPYPEFFARLATLADKGSEVAALVASVTSTPQDSLIGYFATLSHTATMLRDMATEELTGAPFTADQIAFVNRAVRYVQVDMICTKVTEPSGWYVDLFLNKAEINKCKPTIADVHTQPADENGIEVGRIMHVGTSYPRMMVTTVDTCTGPKAYAGVVFAYHERITDKWKRLTDEEWTAEVSVTSPADVSWMADLVAR